MFRGGGGGGGMFPGGGMPGGAGGVGGGRGMQPRYDPIYPVGPDGLDPMGGRVGLGGRGRGGRGRGRLPGEPTPDHLKPPDFDDDMFS
jgi:hypothetical protein